MNQLNRLILLFILIIIRTQLNGQGNTKDVLLINAENHPMKYYMTLPSGWRSEKRWPIVIILEDANKQFKSNALRFKNAAGPLPFILITPVIVSNGSYGYRTNLYPYSKETWDRIEKSGTCEFDLTGLVQIIKEVQKKYNGEDRVFITGFEAGTHLLWAMLFQHPELLAGAAPVAGNYIGRCITENTIPKNETDKMIPIKSFYGSNDTLWTRFLKQQDEKARNKAKTIGFLNIQITGITGKGHVPLPDEVLNYFNSIYQKKQD